MAAALPAGLKPSHHFTYRTDPSFRDLASLDDKERRLFFHIEKKPSVTEEELEKHFSKRQLNLLIKALLEKNAILEKGVMIDTYKPRTERYIRINPALTKETLATPARHPETC
jgi:hypothetical protein